MQYKIPRVVIAATQSGAGKTTLVTGLVAAFRKRGIRVQSYKVGPDYIDPGYHALAGGRPSHNLDSWLMSEASLQELFVRTAQEADIALIEGVMGLYDGGNGGVSSTAQIAKLLDAPVLLVIDAKSMGASAAAVALGFRQYDPEVRIAGVLLNRLGSETHGKMIAEALEKLDIPVYGTLYREDSLHMPERHLGLLPVQENDDQNVISKLGKAIAAHVNLDQIKALAESAPPLTMPEETKTVVSGERVRIAVAKDEAFSFYYPESLQMLEQFGAEIVPFSPLHDKFLPDVDGLILGGGFPEMFAGSLNRNTSMRVSVESAAFFGMPVYAECGGFMYLMDRMRDFEGNDFQMAGVISGMAQMNKKLQMVGYVTAELQQDSVLGPEGMKLRGHEFHFSAEQPVGIEYPRAFSITRMRNGETYLAGYASDNVLGSYLHIHFAGCPDAAKNFVQKCREYKENKD